MIGSDLGQVFKDGNLLRLEIVKARGKRQVIFGKVLQFDRTREILLVYELDYKRVEILSLNEIENVSSIN